jgi:hypothetical protein
MTGFHQVQIGGYSSGGLVQDKKPALLANEAFSNLENAYVWRERTKKRDGEVPMGRLSRFFTSQSLGNSGTSPWTFNIFYFGTGVSGSITAITNANPGQVTSPDHGLSNGMKVTFSGIGGMTQLNGNTYTIGVDTTSYGTYTSGGIWVNQPYAEIDEGSVIIVVGSITFTDNGTGTLESITPGNSGTINYISGSVTLTTTASSGTAATVTFKYFPLLPVMGILRREVSTIGIDSTVFFDTTYAYQYNNGFQELVPGTTWTGTNTDFFWEANYQGASPDLRYFFVTNNNIDIPTKSYDPMRYYNNSAWVDLEPLVTATITLWQARILIPYYGRLLALNTWEGPTGDTYTGAVNLSARCRFSQIGDPTDQTDGWRGDIFGRGGFIDAPTNEAIVGAAFFRNTLIVFFEYSTWQLRYIGEYGLPFIFERISSDFGSISTFSSIVFDQGVMTVSNRGIIQAAANGVTRLDDQIPEQVFSFEIQNDAPNFVHGIRDFEKELVYWNYLDTSTASTTQTYPNTVLLFNYRNNTWAKFRDTITCFGPAQFTFGITWDSLTTFWESNVSWDNVDDQNYVDYITAGTQQGFINIYQNPDAETPLPVTTLYANTMAVTAVNFSVHPTQVTIPSHNLENSEIIYLQGLLWVGTDPGLNNVIYSVTIVDANTVTLSIWNQASQNYDAIDITSSSTYIGGGLVTLFPKMNIVGKDFNPFQGAGKQFKLSYIDFQMDCNLFSPAIPATTIQLFVNSYLGEQANLIATNQELINSSQNCGFITFAAQANPCQITSPGHSLITGTLIYVANIQGMTQLNAAIYSITVVDANNFTLDNTNSTGFTPYTLGGIWNTSPVNGQTYIPGSEYAWYRFYSTQFGQYLRVGLTYDDSLMNQLATHQTPMELNAMNLWFREGGRLIN